jgi:hypothetical protein
MPEELELESSPEGIEINPDTIIDALSDEHADDEDEEHAFYPSLHDDDEDGDIMDTNFEIMDHDKHW